MRHGMILMLMGLLFLASGCASTPQYKLFDCMQRVDGPPAQPPPGKSLVVFHRVSNMTASGLYFHIWEGKRFVGITRGKQGLAYVCEPGEHFFVGRCQQNGHWGAVEFGEKTTAFSATLLPNQVYDVLCLAHNAIVVHYLSFQPIQAGDIRRRKAIPKWTRSQRWMDASQPSDPLLTELNVYLSQTLQKAREHAATYPVMAPEDHR